MAESGRILHHLANNIGDHRNLVLFVGFQGEMGSPSSVLLSHHGLHIDIRIDRDAAGYGVADASDKCPNTPAGTGVDATGCPSDSDRDGV